MAKTKSKKKKKSGTAKKVKPSDVDEIPVDGEAEDEMSAGEKFLMASKPYWAHIALGVLACIFASVLWTNFKNMSLENDALPWQELSNAMTQANLSSDVSSLKEMADKNEGTAASHWARLFAGDNEVNRGIDMLSRDRISGLKMIGSGVESLQKVVDASPSSKTPMVQKRSLFRLASAQEALGEFDVAKGHYQTILDEYPESPWASPSERGVARCSNPDMVAIYEQFRNWDESAAVAPGALVPDRPKLNFDSIKLPEGEPDTISGGDFGGGEMKKEDAAPEGTEMEKKEPETTDAESTEAEMTEKKPAVEAMEEKPVVEEAMPPAKAETTDKPAAEVPAEKPAAEVPVEMPEVKPPATEVPAVEVPKAEVPAVEVPAAEVPKAEVPKVEVPAAEVPKVEVPAVDPPAVEVPAGEGG